MVVQNKFQDNEGVVLLGSLEMTREVSKTSRSPTFQ
jgi:hypothetical protein